MAFTLPRWVTAPVGRVAQTAGRTYDYLTPGAGTSTLTNAGRAVTDKNTVYSGTLNPLSSTFWNGGTSSFTPASKTGGASQPAANTLEDQQRLESQYNGGGDLYGNGGGSGIDRNGLLRTLQQKWTTLGGVLNDIYGNIDAVVKDRANSLNQNYATQEDQLAKDFGNVSGQTSSAYAGRGLADSSYLGQAQDANVNTYDTTLNQLSQDKQSNYAQLGKYAAEQKANVDAIRQQYEPMLANAGQYDDNGLQSIDSGLNESLATANQQRAGMGTDGQFVQKLNAITPVQQQGSAQLQARLQNLIGSTAPVNAKRQIAKGLIKTATLSDPSQADYWNQQFEALLANGGQ